MTSEAKWRKAEELKNEAMDQLESKGSEVNDGMTSETEWGQAERTKSERTERLK
jgi:hypothetical protein